MLSRNANLFRLCFVFTILCVSSSCLPPAVVAQTKNTSRINQAPFQARRRPRPSGRVYKSRISPHWFANNTYFWYRNDLANGTREFILVDATKGTRKPAFDHQRLAKALTQAGVKNDGARKLPFSSVNFDLKKHTVLFRAGNKNWQCDLKTYKLSKHDGRKPASKSTPKKSTTKRRPSRRFRASDRSPDGKWRAFVKNNNVVVTKVAGSEEITLSKDGSNNNKYTMLQWAGDSKTLVAFRMEPGERKEVHLVESSPRSGGRAKLRSRPYPLPGDKFTAYELNLFNVDKKTQTKPKVDRVDFHRPRLRWNQAGSRFTYQKVDRGHQRFRVIEVDPQTGKARNIIDEKSKTFVLTYYSRNVALTTYLQKTSEIIYSSEKDGHRHLYLVDIKKGSITNQITKGPWIVRDIDKIDETARQIWFRASGLYSGQDPYLIHYCRVNFDGSGLVKMTAGNGNHTIQYSPDRKFLLATYNRVDLPPVHELRRVSDGKRVCDLETADVSELTKSGWKPAEVFSAKGRDGKTDIWGFICRPRNFDSKKKYPIIEAIYAGPHDSFVPKTFSSRSRYRDLTDLGFIVVKIDGMGTANRSKAFHDVCWHNLKDAGFPDRILWIKAAAKKYSQMDISRVGVYGTSAGGQSAMGALLFHGDFYKAAVSACGCHDNRMDKSSWNEQWMGYPVGPHYAASSNVDHAHKLRGKLLLIVGELDTNVPPESTMRVVASLIKARKDFDLLVLPGAGHTSGGSYGRRRLQDFFVRHLRGETPPDRNAAVKK